MNNTTITAKMAHDRADAVHQSEKDLLLRHVYQSIMDAAIDGRYRVEFEIHNIEVGNHIFNSLTSNDYYVEIESEQRTGLQDIVKLVIGWENVTFTNDRKYLLPLDNTEFAGPDDEVIRAYAYREDGCWAVSLFREVEAENFAFVDEEDLDDAPEWVKAIEPVEVKD